MSDDMAPPISAHLGDHLAALCLSCPLYSCTPYLSVYFCLSFPVPVCFLLALCYALAVWVRGRQTASALSPVAWGGALGPASPHPETHRDSDGLCPFYSAGCQVLGPDSSVRRAFQVVGSLAKGMKVGMTVACGGPGSQDSQSRATQTGHLGAPWWPEALASLLPAVNWEGSCGNWQVI